MQHIIGKGYYAFMNVGEFIKAKGWAIPNRSVNISPKISALPSSPARSSLPSAATGSASRTPPPPNGPKARLLG
jgi:hypothetical protein